VRRGLGQDAVEEPSLVEVALEPAITREEAVKQDRQRLVLLEGVLWQMEPHGRCEALA
jgi:hypothetical protein